MSRCLTAVLMVAVYMAGSCAGPGRTTAPSSQMLDLSLMFTQGESSRYVVTTTSVQEVDWSGSLPERQEFTGGKNATETVLWYTARTLSVDAEGTAVVEITIEDLTYHAALKDRPPIRFDSRSGEDEASPLAALKGRGYTLKINTSGQVIGLIDAEDIRMAVDGDSDMHKLARRLVDTEVIKLRHGIDVVPSPDQGTLAVGDRYTSDNSFSFGLMGSRSYRKVYTLESVRRTGGATVTQVRMEASPTLEGQQTAALPGNFDTSETYTGKLSFDSTAGKIINYREDLQLHWTVLQPASDQQAEPMVLSMTARRSYELARVD